MAPCALSYASDGGAARICQRGAKARERRSGGGCGRGVSPSHGREIFQNLCLKTVFSCTLDTFIRGSLCSGAHRPIPYSCSFFILFLMNLFQGNIFLFLSFFFCFTRRSMGGGGGMAPLCILAIPVTVVQPRFVNGGKARERSDRARGDFFQICV